MLRELIEKALIFSPPSSYWLEGVPDDDEKEESQSNSLTSTSPLPNSDFSSSPKRWRGVTSMALEGMFNPTIAYWLHRPLLAYREQMYDVPISFEWFDFHRDSEVEISFGNSGRGDDYGLRYSNNELTIREFEFNQLTEDARLIPLMKKKRRKEGDGERERGGDGEGDLMVMYTCKASLFSPPMPCYFHMTLIPHPHKVNKKIIHFTDSVVMEDHPYVKSQKNWIPLLAKGGGGREDGNGSAEEEEEEEEEKLYFIQSINPFHLLLHNETNEKTRRGKAYLVHERPEIPLPWSEEYGLPLRGGTPAYLLKNMEFMNQAPPPLSQQQQQESSQDDDDELKMKEEGAAEDEELAEYPSSLYIAFFHTVLQRSAALGSGTIRTYFMGAITFCPNYPFEFFSVSTHPILQEKYYEGEWADPPKIDFVMFPIGVFERPIEELRNEQERDDLHEQEIEDEEKLEEEVESDFKERRKQKDEEIKKRKEKREKYPYMDLSRRYLWVTFGVRDKNGAVAQFDLKRMKGEDKFLSLNM